MTMASVWRDRATATKKRKLAKAKRSTWTDLCSCGHPRINHLTIDPANAQTYAAECPCGCKSFRRAKRSTRRSRR